MASVLEHAIHYWMRQKHLVGADGRLPGAPSSTAVACGWVGVHALGLGREGRGTSGPSGWGKFALGGGKVSGWDLGGRLRMFCSADGTDACGWIYGLGWAVKSYLVC